MIWKNSEGYYDPTAGAALSRIIRDERKKRWAEQQAAEEGTDTVKNDTERDLETKQEEAE